MKEQLKKYKIYHFLSIKYHHIISGYTYHKIVYDLLYYMKDKNELKKLGFNNIKKYKIENWRFGNEKDKVYRRYFTGTYDGKICFVKIAKNDLTIRNEIKIQKLIKKYDFNYSPKTILIVDNFNFSYSLLAIEFIENLRTIDEITSKTEFEKFCEDFLKTLKEFEKIGLIHADINKGNLMLCDRGLILFDYGISYCKNINNEINYFDRPGTFYIDKEKTRTYDDAYSFVKLIESYKKFDNYLNSKSYVAIEDRIGEVKFTIKK